MELALLTQIETLSIPIYQDINTNLVEKVLEDLCISSILKKCLLTVIIVLKISIGIELLTLVTMKKLSRMKLMNCVKKRLLLARQYFI